MSFKQIVRFRIIKLVTNQIGTYFLFRFSGQQPPNFENLRTEPKAAFQYAAFVGANSAKNLKVCAQVFDRCPFNAKIILEVLNSRSAGFLAEESQTSSPPTAPTAPTAQTAPTVPTRNI